MENNKLDSENYLCIEREIESHKKLLSECNYKLYKYCSLDNDKIFVENLKAGKVFFNSIKNFNDIFEYSCICTDNTILRTIYRVSLAEEEINPAYKHNFPTFESFLEFSSLTLDEQKRKFEDIYSLLKVKDKANYKTFKEFYVEKLIYNTSLIVQYKNNPKSFSDNEYVSQIKEYLADTINKITAFNSKMKNELINGHYKIACFSEDFDNPVMWGNYASKNKGFVIEYNFNPDNNCEDRNKLNEHLFYINKVQYIDEPVDIPAPTTNKHLKMQKIVEVIKPLYYKKEVWSYEKEWREVHLDSSDEITLIDYLTPSKIIAGVNSDANLKNELKKICEKNDVIYEELEIDPLNFTLRIKKQAKSE